MACAVVVVDTQTRGQVGRERRTRISPTNLAGFWGGLNLRLASPSSHSGEGEE
jgi:hypothetical protein